MAREELEALATGRRTSLFREELERHGSALSEAVKGARVAVIGAAGSIGAAVVRQLVPFRPRSLALFDLSENNLVEVVRDLRSSEDLPAPEEFEALPIGMGSPEFRRYFEDAPPCDLILNLAAVKHVRSEKDVYTLMRMIDTNVVFPHELLRSLKRPVRKFFSVSSDKAANPANLMGASKMIMEDVMMLHAERQPVSSARFANVSFSDGSLPHGFLQRIEKRQPLSAPRDVRRYFISHREAGELCLLSAALGNNRESFFPKLEERLHAETFSTIAERLLRHLGYEPVACGSEAEARRRAGELVARRHWPCFFFDSDTTGEKDVEEFFTGSDALDMDRFPAVGVIRREADPAGAPRVARFLEFARRLKGGEQMTKAAIVEAFREAVPTLTHVETGRNLDRKM